jgi:hypothetical protein
MVIQEVKWIGSDILDSGEYRVFYSRNENNTFGTGFLVHRDYKGKRSLRTWERKILRKIYGPVYDNEIWRIRTNKELMALYQELDIVAEIKKARLRWLGHVERMSEDRVIKNCI